MENRTYVVKIEAVIPNFVIKDADKNVQKDLLNKPWAEFHGAVKAKNPLEAVSKIIENKLGKNGEYLKYFHRIHVDEMRDGYVE